jgi:heme/copper-type cytochrome/quinol oxidase subunit 3
MAGQGLASRRAPDPPGIEEAPGRGGGSPPTEEPPRRQPLVTNARLALTFFIGAETMLFAGLMSAHVVLRAAAGEWPPVGQPRLPVGVTAANSAALFTSAVAALAGWRAIRAGNRARLGRRLAAAALLGALFLGVQGGEWIRLVRHGLSLSNTYGAGFAALIGLHAVHVAGGLLWLLYVGWRSLGWHYSARRHEAVELSVIYWVFVCALWAALFPLVYLGY